MGDAPLPVEDGIVARSAVLDRILAARAAIERSRPGRIVTFGGACSVSLAPFSHLAAKHAGDVGVLWIDAHTDLYSSDDNP